MRTSGYAKRLADGRYEVGKVIYCESDRRKDRLEPQAVVADEQAARLWLTDARAEQPQ